MIENHSAPLGTMIPTLIYDDVAKAIDWLCSVFGFTERLRIAGGDGKAGHAQLAMGEGGVMLGASRTEGPGTAESVAYRPPRTNEVSQTICVRVDDVDRHYERAKERGARIVRPPATYPYGERQYSAEDCEGHRWTFTQATADVKPEEWGATAGKIEERVVVLPRPRWCYLEIPAVDVHVSASFYEKVFGWNIRRRESARPSFDDATGIVSGAWATGRSIANRVCCPTSGWMGSTRYWPRRPRTAAKS